MRSDPFTELIANANSPEMISLDGQALSLMYRLLVHLHQIRPASLDLLSIVFNEYQRAGLDPESFCDVIVPGDGLRSFMVRFMENRYTSFVASTEAWLRSTNLRHHNVLVVGLSVISDERLRRRDPTLTLNDHLLAIMTDLARYTRSHNALEFSLTPMLTLPAYNPLFESRAAYQERCSRLLQIYIQEVERIYEQQGAGLLVKRTAEETHLRALAYKILHPEEKWEQIGTRPDIALSTSSVREGCVALAQRLGISLTTQKTDDS